jgi:hypothetical protein
VTSRAMVTGSRDWTSRNTVFAALANAEFSLRSPIEVLHGGLDRGADAFASQWCRETGTSQRNYWPSGVVNRDSLLARNIAMVNDAPDVVLAFFMPGSRGTWHAVTAALEAGIPVRWFVQDGLTRADVKKLPVGRGGLGVQRWLAFPWASRAGPLAERAHCRVFPPARFRRRARRGSWRLDGDPVAGATPPLLGGVPPDQAAESPVEDNHAVDGVRWSCRRCRGNGRAVDPEGHVGHGQICR